MSERIPKSGFSAPQAGGRSKLPPYLIGNIALIVLSAVITTLILGFRVQERLGSEFVVGEPAPRSLFSPFVFTYEDLEATNLRRDRIASEIKPLYRLDPSKEALSMTRLKESIQAWKAYQALPAESRAQEALSLSLPFSIQKMNELTKGLALVDLEKFSEMALQRFFSRGIIDEKDYDALVKGSHTTVTLIRNSPEGKEEIAPVQSFRTMAQLSGVLDEELPQEIGKNKNLRAAVREIVLSLLEVNLQADSEGYAQRQTAAVQSVPVVIEKIMKNELIVQRGMKILLRDRMRIEQLEKKTAEHKVLNQLFADGVFVALIYGLVVAYLWILERKVLLAKRLCAFTVTVFVFTVFVSKLIGTWPGSSYFLMPLALAPLLFSMLAGPRYGFLSASVMTAFAGPLSEFSAEVMLCTLFSGLAASFAGYKVRKRYQFLRVGFLIGLVYAVALFAFRTFHEYAVEESLQLSILGLANGFLITMPLAFLVLPVLEYFFNLTTDISLLELSDLNHPILKRMVLEAPGTYHHSLVVSTLAESACEAIGANALLARVGCYFHDIGKIARAEFFTENMKSQAESKHHKLTPTMSCLVIMNHVKDGLELGRKFRLKERILQFIPEHQGTGVIYYFYRKAMDHAKSGEKINPNDFRYPGPKPQSKETAVALLADSTEAASRSLKNPSAESIRQLVRKIINDKFIDGQLDECNLSLKDLHKIQESFIYNLMAIFHTRVHYPVDSDVRPDRPDLFKDDQFEKYRVPLSQDDH